MSRLWNYLRILLLLLLPSFAVSAAPPATLGYQGRLATAGGLPVSGTLNITFRLYAVPTGGSPLWSEVQSNVDVDGGNLAVELGTVTALPKSIWGQQLYLGVQISGDSEMLPRPALTAAPFALRAATTMQRTLFVSADGTPVENGAALLAAIASITDASATSPVVVEIDAGTFDLGQGRLYPPEYTTLSGRGQEATRIVSSTTTPVGSLVTGETILLRSNTTVRDLTAINSGVPAGANDSVVGISAYDPTVYQQPVTNVHLERVSGQAIAPAGSNGQRAGINLCAANSRATDVVAVGDGGQYAMALRADCPSINFVLDGAELYAANASLGLRGAFLTSGYGNAWRRLRVEITVSPSIESVWGLRFLAPGSFHANGPQGVLSDSSILIRGSGLATPTQMYGAAGIRLENDAQLALIERVRVQVEALRALRFDGLRLLDRASASSIGTRLVDLDFSISGMNDSDTVGGITGLRIDGYPPELTRANIKVDCAADSQGVCVGIMQNYYSWTPPSGELILDDSHIRITHAGLPGNGASHSAALWAMGPSRIRNTHLEVFRAAQSGIIATISIHAPIAVNLTDSTVIATDAANSNSACFLGAAPGSSGEWFGNHLQGTRCDSATLTCAGNTVRGVGFLANACP